LLKRNASARPDTAAPVLEGYDFADCDALDGDVTRAAVRWKGRDDLLALKGQSVFVHLQIHNGTVFGVRFADA
jgi:hypothetical protein